MGKFHSIQIRLILHHRLLESGLNQRETVNIIWSLSALFAVIALVIDGRISSIFILYS